MSANTGKRQETDSNECEKSPFPVGRFYPGRMEQICFLVAMLGLMPLCPLEEEIRLMTTDNEYRE